MTLDLRGLSFSDSFKEIRDAIVLAYTLKEEIVAFLGANENEKCTLLKGFIELLLDCKIILEESNGFYMLKIMPS
jgi:ABC-type cobalamin/Fe3+-siderophores transport system ATPase subunit